MHRALDAAAPSLAAIIVNEEPEQPNTSPFHDLLHEYSLFARPTTAAAVTDLAVLLGKLMNVCHTDPLSWKVLALTALLRRYHAKAPQAREDEDTEGVGDGERLVFYVTVLALQRFAVENGQGAPEAARCAEKAANALVKAAAQVGGTRDINALIEHLTLAMLMAQADVPLYDAPPPAIFADCLVPAVRAIMVTHPLPSLLESLLATASSQLDSDFALLQQKKDEKDGVQPKDEEEALMSTLHVTMAHSGRGSNTKNAWHRKLTNAVAEILIWQRTKVAGVEDERFVPAWHNFRQLAPTTSDVNNGHVCLQQMQTSACKLRQQLNQHAREQGFLLSSTYLMDTTSPVLLYDK